MEVMHNQSLTDVILWSLGRASRKGKADNSSVESETSHQQATVAAEQLQIWWKILISLTITEGTIMQNIYCYSIRLTECNWIICIQTYSLFLHFACQYHLVKILQLYLFHWQLSTLSTNRPIHPLNEVSMGILNQLYNTAETQGPTSSNRAV
jgi:hypothetical protein